MRPWSPHSCQLSAPAWIARGQLPQQVIPFEHKLTARNGKLAARPRATDLVSREVITAGLGLRMNHAQIFGDEAHRRRAVAKADELRMMRVAARLSPQHGLREQRFPPQGH